MVASLLASCAALACSAVLDLGEPRELVSSAGAGAGAGVAGAGGSDGGQGGSAGSTSGGTAGGGNHAGGSGGSQVGGSAGSGGSQTGGSAGSGDAGYCEAGGAPPAVDAGAGLTYFFDAQDPAGPTDRSGDCSLDDPKLGPLLGQPAANCDYAGALSREWIRIFQTATLACVGCFEQLPKLWVEFLFALEQPFGAPGAVVFQPLLGSAAVTNAVHAAVLIDEQRRLGLSCGGNAQFASHPVLGTAIQMLTYEYDFATRTARLWRRSTSEGYAMGQLSEPVVTLQCPCDEPADGWFTQGNAGGDMRLNGIRIAPDHARIDASY